LNGQTFLLLLAAIASVGVFFTALTNQMIAPPKTTMACDQQALSMNSHPKQLIDELDRELQNSWTEQVPNRKYSRVMPVISNGTGTFATEILEETQPLPRDDMQRVDLNTCFTLPRYKWLCWLDGMGVALTFAGVVSLLLFSAWFEPRNIEPKLFMFTTFGVAMLIVGGFCFKAGHALWGRFDFLSELIWVEMKGNYQSAKLDYGNQFTDRVKTEKQVINIESMTLRVWVTELHTVSFGKDSQRCLVGMRGLPDKAKYLGQHLSQFAANQSIIVAPTSAADMQKVATMGVINQLGGGQESTQGVLQAISNIAKLGSASDKTEVTAPIPVACPSCSASIEADERFCSNCGYKLASE